MADKLVKTPRTAQAIKALELVKDFAALTEWHNTYGDLRLFRESDGSAVIAFRSFYPTNQPNYGSISEYDGHENDRKELVVLHFGFDQKQVIHCRNLHVYFNVF
jgi:hypothetical protein